MLRSLRRPAAAATSLAAVPAAAVAAAPTGEPVTLLLSPLLPKDVDLTFLFVAFVHDGGKIDRRAVVVDEDDGADGDGDGEGDAIGEFLVLLMASVLLVITGIC